MSSAASQTGNGTKREWLTLAREALAIVLTGAVLGLAFNHLQLSSRPPRGLAWVGATQPVDCVDGLAPPAVAAQSLTESAEGMAAPISPPGSRPAAPSQPATDPGEASAPTSSAIPMAAVPGPPATADPAGPPAYSPPAAGLPAGLPAIPDAGQPIKVDLHTVAPLVEAGAALVVDARDPGSFADGHIPGAVNVPYGEAVRDPARLGKLDPRGRPVIVYCSGSTCQASMLLAQIMVRDLDMRRVLVYEKGYPEWVAAGKPVTRETR